MGIVDKGRLPKPLTSLFNLGRSYSVWVYQWVPPSARPATT